MQSPLEITRVLQHSFLTGEFDDLLARYDFPVGIIHHLEGQILQTSADPEQATEFLADARARMIALGSTSCEVENVGMIDFGNGTSVLNQVTFVGPDNQVLKRVDINYLMVRDDSGWRIKTISGGRAEISPPHA